MNTGIVAQKRKPKVKKSSVQRYKFLVTYDGFNYNFPVSKDDTMAKKLGIVRTKMNEPNVYFKFNHFYVDPDMKPDGFGALLPQHSPPKDSTNHVVDEVGKTINILEPFKLIFEEQILIHILLLNTSIVIKVPRLTTFSDIYQSFDVLAPQFAHLDHDMAPKGYIHFNDFNKTLKDLKVDHQDSLQFFFLGDCACIRHIPFSGHEKLNGSVTNLQKGGTSEQQLKTLDREVPIITNNSEQINSNGNKRTISFSYSLTPSSSSSSEMNNSSNDVNSSQISESSTSTVFQNEVKKNGLKRPRKSPACLPCRSKKKGCDRAQPCKGCSTRNIECIYPDPSPPNGDISNKPPLNDLANEENISLNSKKITSNEETNNINKATNNNDDNTNNNITTQGENHLSPAVEEKSDNLHEDDDSIDMINRNFEFPPDDEIEYIEISSGTDDSDYVEQDESL